MKNSGFKESKKLKIIEDIAQPAMPQEFSVNRFYVFMFCSG